MKAAGPASCNDGRRGSCDAAPSTEEYSWNGESASFQVGGFILTPIGDTRRMYANRACVAFQRKMSAALKSSREDENSCTPAECR
jgi:hypothetical protein